MLRFAVETRSVAEADQLGGNERLRNPGAAEGRERRRELALLRTLGFFGRQLHATLSWHASVVAPTALAVGVPLGIALGRAVWRWFAGGLDVSAPAKTPWMWLVVALVATVVLANVVAAIPGRSAARTRPAVILRDA